MNGSILDVENLSKKFCRDLKRSLWYGVKDLASEMLLRRDERAGLRSDEFWALKDVSFQVRRGEMLGLIGANGAGKSTLLRLINGLIKPDQGKITVHGRVGALIALGAGFNPILTGRENIYVNAAVLGIPKREVDRKLEAMIDFAEIGDFIDAPVQSYSSGMMVRLGYSVAAHLDPDLLLIDEVLSVGDSSFRARCYDHLNRYRKNGGTAIFVSHNTVAVEAACDRVMWLDQGRVMDIGEPAQVVLEYETKAAELSRQAERRIRGDQASDSADDIRFTAVECYDLAGNPKSEFEFGESFEVRLQFKSRKDIHSPYFVIAIRKGASQNPLLSMMAMNWSGIHLETIPKQGVIGCVIKSPNFSPCTYRLYVGVLANISGKLGEKWYVPLTEFGLFTILPGSLKDRFPGMPSAHIVSTIPPLLVEHSWTLNGQPLKYRKACHKAS
jgi:lipopolysaccharide transport system ATP-binding protein